VNTDLNKLLEDDQPFESFLIICRKCGSREVSHVKGRWYSEETGGDPDELICNKCGARDYL